MPDSPNAPDRELAVWRVLAALARLFPSRHRVTVLIVLVGTMSAVGESLTIGLAVVLLFTLMRESERIESSGGVLGEFYAGLVELIGTQTYILPIVFAMLLLATASLAYANNAIAGIMLNRVSERVRNRIHDTYLRVGYGWLQRHDHGELMHIIGNESWTVADAFFSVARIGVSLCAVAVFGTALFLLAWPIGLAALGGAIVAFLMLRVVARPVRRLGRKTLEANHVLSDRMLVSLSGMRTLRLFAVEDDLEARFQAASTLVRRRAIRTELVKAATGPLSQAFGLGVLLLMVVVAGYAGIDVPTTITAVLLLFRLQPYLYEIENERVALAGMSAALRQVLEMIAPSDAQWPSQGVMTFDGLEKSLVFEKVTLTHDPRKGASVSDLSLTIRAGCMTALEGPSGSGKTTVLNLILRLYEPDSGRILVDGRDLAEISRGDWLRHLAIAGQDVELIEGTVLENIAIGRPESKLEDVRAVCRLSEILDEIETLPDGFDTAVGAAGLSFSGGQRQRLGLARALLKDPQILVLDEAMSALEADRETRISARIAERMRGRTVIKVSHRWGSTIAADHVIRIRNGRIDATRGGA